VRNAVDHGIEPPARRVAAGKPAEGTLRLSAHHLGNQIFIELGDDGGGIDPARLRSKAQALGLASAAELVAMDDREALELIFRAGFSTAARVSEVSGRGVGMDVVRDTVVKKLKGEIDVASVVGQGTTLTLRLPLTLAIIQVLLAGVGGDVFAIPLDTVTRTLTCAPTDLHRLADREVLAVQGRQVPIIRLTDVLELGSDGAEGPILHVVLIEAQGQPVGLVCDRLVGKQEIVIKSLADLLVDVPCAAGATLLGDRVALILDVSAVIQRAQRRGAAALGPPAAAAPVVPPPAAAPRILLVEDSDVIRQHLRRQLEAAGYHVVEARDGREGLDLARRERFDLVSTDVVMPRMDGYELTRALRAEAGYKDTPIIMVTSRGEKIDRVRGFDAGVDEYLTKPHDRNELIAAIAKHVRGRSGGGA
jgi:two-component system chemotaxis sensor kinase CheA